MATRSKPSPTCRSSPAKRFACQCGVGTSCRGGTRGVRKKGGAPRTALEVKVDTYVLETDVHFPTGLNRCLDVGLDGDRRDVGLGVLSYNLPVIGRALQARQRVRAETVRLAA